MTPILVIASVVGLPLFLALIFRVNAILLFLSVAIGGLLARHLGEDAAWILANFIKDPNLAAYTNIGLLLLPVLLTLVLLKKTVVGSRLFLQFIPLLLVSAMLGSVVISYLPVTLSDSVYANPIGKIVKQSTDVLIAATAVLMMLMAWFTFREPPHRTKKSKH
ncbi:MAG: hypothetical protein AAB459_02800 [Patescibacteria group bacterium]